MINKIHKSFLNFQENRHQLEDLPLASLSQNESFFQHHTKTNDIEKHLRPDPDHIPGYQCDRSRFFAGEDEAEESEAFSDGSFPRFSDRLSTSSPLEGLAE